MCVTGRVSAKGASCLNGAQHATAAVAMPLQRRYPHLIDTQSTIILQHGAVVDAAEPTLHGWITCFLIGTLAAT